MAVDVRRSEVDRRAMHGLSDEAKAYSGPERRSGEDKRIWIDRVQEIFTKMNQSQGWRLNL